MTYSTTTELIQKYLRIRRHVRQIVHYYEHLNDGSKGIEQSHLNSSTLWNSVSLFTKIDVT